MILDVGCGERNRGTVNVDLTRYKNVNVICDAHYLPFKTSVFHKVLCSQVLEHCNDPFQVLSEIKRVLIYGGMVEVDFPKPFWTNLSKYRLLELLFDFPVVLMKFKSWLYGVNMIPKKHPRWFHRWKLTPKVLSGFFYDVEVSEFGDIFFTFLCYGGKARFFKNKPKVNTAYLCTATKL